MAIIIIPETTWLKATPSLNCQPWRAWDHIVKIVVDTPPALLKTASFRPLKPSTAMAVHQLIPCKKYLNNQDYHSSNCSDIGLKLRLCHRCPEVAEVNLLMLPVSYPDPSGLLSIWWLLESQITTKCGHQAIILTNQRSDLASLGFTTTIEMTSWNRRLWWKSH